MFLGRKEEDGRRQSANGVLEMRLSPGRIYNGFEAAHGALEIDSYRFML